MITDIEDYFSRGCGRCDRFATSTCSTQRWATGLAQLRMLCQQSGLLETVKWGHPCYMHAGRNVVIIGAMLGDFRLIFFHPALMTDPERVLEKQGPNTRHSDVLRFRDVSEVAERTSTVRAYLAEAMGYAEAGVKPPIEPREVDLPVDLLDALDDDPELAEAFRSLTPGRQRSYVIALASAKTEVTRLARIERFRDRILAGKGATER